MQKYSKKADSNDVDWANAKILKMQKKAATLTTGAAILALGAAML